MRKLSFALGALVIVSVGWWCYLPGLSGTFLFDDFNNLDKLGAYGGVHDFSSLVFYLSSGSADPTGRPLSLLSFLIDARNWPADPEPFKRSNVLLHLLNGLLLDLALLKLGLRVKLQRIHAERAALLGAALWTLHPLLVSTTLYVVQREAMLPTCLVLIGILLWLSGRERFFEGRRFGLLHLVLAAWVCTAAALLCKANGILLPLLLLVTEWTLLDSEGEPGGYAAQATRFRMLRRWLLVLPSGLLAIWLLARLPNIFSGETYSRPWTIGQRLITEPRVLCDYLNLLWIPRASGASLFHDGYRASTDLLHPWTTLPALGVIAFLAAFGLRSRRKHSVLCFAILFYLAGQLLESTVIPLELYFEHRNYLPTLPLFWPLAIWLTGEGALRKLRYTLAFLLPAIFALLCHVRAGVWGHPLEQALLLAQIEPDSPRAQANAAAYEIAHGAADRAARRLRAAAVKMPEEVQLTLNWINAECTLGGVGTATIDAALYSLRHNRTNTEFVQGWLTGEIDRAAQVPCRGLDLPVLEQMIEAVRENPNYGDGSGRRSQIELLQGRLALARGDGEAALRDFNEGLSEFTTPDSALLQAALLGSAGFPDLGLKHLDYYRTLPPVDRHLHGMAAVHLWLLERGGYWSSEITGLENQLRIDAAAPPLAHSQLVAPGH
ncbi:MAG: hypothetical protein JWR07_4826 [Nevskia sp.]|nr:hypothetical protein [Nevskia sp.]